MNNKDHIRLGILHVVVGLILFAVCFWDIYGIKVSSWTYYYPFKASIIGIYFVVAYLIFRKKLKTPDAVDISSVVFYIYSFVCTLYLHPTYIFSFYEGMAFIAFYYTGSITRYSVTTLFGLILALISIEYMPEPDFVKEGHSIRHHFHTISLIFGVLSIVIFSFFNRQREIIYQKDQKFAAIGRQAAFLLHELKSPLSRFMMSNSEKDNRDADYILSIVEGVELLITKKDNLHFGELNWKEIESYLLNEFIPICSYYKITFEVAGFEGSGFGHRSTIKLALKNLIKNAVEAISLDGKDGFIKVTRIANTIEVSNNGSVISKEKIGQLFTPFYSGKDTKTNFGIGLHFVESVVKAHNGSIAVNVENGLNIFRIKLGEA